MSFVFQAVLLVGLVAFMHAAPHWFRWVLVRPEELPSVLLVLAAGDREQRRRLVKILRAREDALAAREEAAKPRLQRPAPQARPAQLHHGARSYPIASRARADLERARARLARFPASPPTTEARSSRPFRLRDLPPGVHQERFPCLPPGQGTYRWAVSAGGECLCVSCARQRARYRASAAPSVLLDPSSFFDDHLRDPSGGTFVSAAELNAAMAVLGRRISEVSLSMDTLLDRGRGR